MLPAFKTTTIKTSTTNMFDSPVLDLVILLSFTYFVGSLVLSAINEALAGFLELRQKHLRQALENMFNDPGWKPFIRNHFMNSPHIQALVKAKGQFPAYISSSNFVLTVVEQIKAENYTPDKIKAGIQNSILPKQFQKVLLDLLAQAKNDIATFEKKLEEFYNNVMDRTTGWYKKDIRKILLIVGFIISVALNIDTIKIANDTLRDPKYLSKTADQIAAHLSQIQVQNDSIIVKDSAGKIFYTTAGKYSTTPKDSISVNTLMSQTQNLKVVYEQSAGYKLGYNGEFKTEWSKHFLLKLLGVLITTFALQLNASYWFDLMNRVVNIRSVGNKPDDSKDNTSK
ncbi:hypothetical protein [Taibaiella soli]|uniref:Uncharacterized protein n=1 Tax=Taibaiella soli TaxID=1649169 RepID=A0A2W2AGR9_9BACT|nr:hypothetical protein [Taibaiella soli]PZF74461.1 hypothetical protein DN068_02450 [Taibaiella soli]